MKHVAVEEEVAEEEEEEEEEAVKNEPLHFRQVENDSW